jgi:geranylgeranyl pyrophosphate synthase
MTNPLSQTDSLSLESFLGYCQQRTNSALDELLTSAETTQQLLEAMRYATLHGGKRLRPVLVYAAAEAVQADAETADLPACAVELIHSYSLAHDDLPAMDDDDLRRGKPSLHKTYDDATAILVGDALQCLAFEILSSPSKTLPESCRMKMLNVLSQAAGARGMVGGQSEDFAAVGKDISIAQLESMHSKKTGALIAASVTLGGLCQPDIDPGSLNALEQYAARIGLAFQVQDDVLDEVGDTSTLGKHQGSDRLKNKPTYVSLLGLDGARSKALELADEAIAALDEFPDCADQLRNIASYIVSRNY